MKNAVIATTLLLFSLAAQAAEIDSRPWFVVAAGNTLLAEDEGVSNDVRTGLMAGAGWDFSQMLAAEFNLVSLGSYNLEGGAGEFEASSLSASLLPHLKFDRVRLFGRAGLGLWRASLSGTPTEMEVDPLLGIGVDVRLGRAITEWSLRAEATRHFSVGEAGVTGESDIDTLLIGFSFRH